jgi:hypothetical protein
MLGPYHISNHLTAFRRLLNFPIAWLNANQNVDEKLIAAARLVVGTESKLDSMPGMWIIKTSKFIDWVELTTNESKAKRHKSTSASLEQISLDSADHCVFEVGPGKDELFFPREEIAAKSDVLNNMVNGTGVITASSKISLPGFSTEVVKLVLERLLLHEHARQQVEIPHETFTQAQQLSAFLLLDFSRLKLTSDMFYGETGNGFDVDWPE